MSIRKRLLLFAILFAAVSLVALLFAARPLSSDYSLRPLGAVRLGELSDTGSDAEDADSGEGSPDEEGEEEEGEESDDEADPSSGERRGRGLPREWVTRTDKRLSEPVSVRQGDLLAVISDRAVVSIPRHDYAALGDGIVATGNPDTEASGSSLVATVTGETFLVEQAERIWLDGGRVLALADGGRRAADISREISVPGPEQTSDEEIVTALGGETQDSENGGQEGLDIGSRVAPEWFTLPGPVTAAAPVAGATAVGDALGGITLVQGDDISRRFKLLASEAQGTILSLAASGRQSEEFPATLYAVGGYEPSKLFRLELTRDGDDGTLEDLSLQSTAEVELPGSVNTPVHVRVGDDRVMLAAGGALLAYNRDLEPVAQRSFDSPIGDIGFLAGGRLVFAHLEQREGSKVDVFYADGLEDMYSLSFPREIDSIRAVDGALVTADDREVVVYGEVFR